MDKMLSLLGDSSRSRNTFRSYKKQDIETQNQNATLNQLIQSHFKINNLLSKCIDPQRRQGQKQLFSSENKQKFEKINSVAQNQPDKANISDLNHQISKLKVNSAKLYFYNFQSPLQDSRRQIQPKKQPNKESQIKKRGQPKQEVLTILVKSYCVLANFQILQMGNSYYEHAEQLNPEVEAYLQKIQFLLEHSKTYNQIFKESCLAHSLTQLCIREILNIKSVKQLQFYNINANEQFKYEEKTQANFLLIMGAIKCSAHLKMFDLSNKTSEKARIIQTIYCEGKQSLQRLKQVVNISLSTQGLIGHNKQLFTNNQFSDKTISAQRLYDNNSLFWVKKVEEIEGYLNWVQQNWLKNFKKQSNEQFKELPIQFMVVYQFFYAIHKLSQFEERYVLNNDIKSGEHLPNHKGLSKHKSDDLLRNPQELLKKAEKSKNLLQNYLQQQKREAFLKKQKVVQPGQQDSNVVLMFLQKSLEKSTQFDKKNNLDFNLTVKLERLINNPSFLYLTQKVQKTQLSNRILQTPNNKVQQTGKPAQLQRSHLKIQNQVTEHPTADKNQLNVQVQRIVNKQSKIMIQTSSIIQSLKKPNQNQNDSSQPDRQVFQYQDKRTKAEYQKQIKAQQTKLFYKNQQDPLSNPSKNSEFKVIAEDQRRNTLSDKNQTTPNHKKTEKPFQRSINLLDETKSSNFINNKDPKFIKNMLSVCRTGQYLTKFNYNNNSSAVKFVKLSISNDTLKWSDKQADIDDGASEYKFSKICGIVFGDVTQKIIYHCQKSKQTNQLIEPWRCFSLICKNRTLDFYCHMNQYDVYFWLSGLAHHMKAKHKKPVEFSRGKILWKQCLIKFRFMYSEDNMMKQADRQQRQKSEKDKRAKKSKETKLKQKGYYLGKSNARAIINFGKIKMVQLSQ